MQKSSFFNSVAGDRKYRAEEWAEYFNSFIGNGVFPKPSTGLQVLANNSMAVTVKTGKAWINGYFYYNTADLSLQIPTADGVLNRVDRVVVRWDLQERSITAQVKKGTASASPIAPVLQRDADAYEIALADVYVSAGTVSIAQANITDQRLNNALCGLVVGTVGELETSSFYNQIQADLIRFQNVTQADFNEWFETIKGVLDENTAGQLLNMITALQDGKANKSVTRTTTLYASTWSGSSPPYTYNLSVSGVTTTSNQELLPSTTITSTQLEALQAANIQDGGQASGKLTLKAWGDKPTINIPVRVIVRGDA